MNKINFTILACGLLLTPFLVSGGLTQTRDPVTRELTGVLRINKAMGVIPRGQEVKEAGAPCGHFYVAVLDPANKYKSVAYASVTGGRDDGEFYTCRYSLRVPAYKGLYAVAGMGGVLLLPEQSRARHHITDAWIGGTRNKPPAGHERAFIPGGKYITLTTKAMYLKFDLGYIRVDPN